MTAQHIARDPGWQPIDEIQREMERLLDHFARGKRARFTFSEAVWQPQVDVYETDDHLVVLADLAGVPRDEIQIEIEQDHLSLSGERRLPHRPGEKTFYALEVRYGAFRRQIRLPYSVDNARAVASYRDGFLEILMPRLIQPEPRRVQIRATGAESE